MLEVLIARREICWYRHCSAEKTQHAITGLWFMIFWVSLLLKDWAHPVASTIAAVLAMIVMLWSLLIESRKTSKLWVEYQASCDAVRDEAFRIIGRSFPNQPSSSEMEN